MATYAVASSYILMKEPPQLMGAPLFKTNRWAQSSLYPVRPFQTRISHLLLELTTCTTDGRNPVFIQSDPFKQEYPIFY